MGGQDLSNWPNILNSGTVDKDNSSLLEQAMRESIELNEMERSEKVEKTEPKKEEELK